MRDCIDLKRELGLPVLPETREAILELESDILAIKLKVLRSHHPDQLLLDLNGRPFRSPRKAA